MPFKLYDDHHLQTSGLYIHALQRGLTLTLFGDFGTYIKTLKISFVHFGLLVFAL